MSQERWNMIVDAILAASSDEKIRWTARILEVLEDDQLEELADEYLPDWAMDEIGHDGSLIRWVLCGYVAHLKKDGAA